MLLAVEVEFEQRLDGDEEESHAWSEGKIYLRLFASSRCKCPMVEICHACSDTSKVAREAAAE